MPPLSTKSIVLHVVSSISSVDMFARHKAFDKPPKMFISNNLSVRNSTFGDAINPSHFLEIYSRMSTSSNKMFGTLSDTPSSSCFVIASISAARLEELFPWQTVYLTSLLALTNGCQNRVLLLVGGSHLHLGSDSFCVVISAHVYRD